MKIGVFVGENGKWTFFEDVFRELSNHYQLDVFDPKIFRVFVLYGRLNRWMYSRRMQSILRNSDICFFEWASELLVPASHMPKCCPIVTRLHSYEINVWAPKVNWAHVDKIIFVSEKMRQRFCEMYPATSHKTAVINNGVNLEKFRPPAHRNFGFNLGMLCSIHPAKRIYEVVLLMHKLRLQGYEAHLHIAGGKWPGGYFDDYYMAIRQAIQKLNLENHVTLYDHVEETSIWLENIDIFISNSYWEGQQVALLEALAVGCYCLSHFWDGAEEVLPLENLYITEDELMQKIIEYQGTSEEEKVYKHASMRAIACEKFDIEQMIARIRVVIDDLGTDSTK